MWCGVHVIECARTGDCSHYINVPNLKNYLLKSQIRVLALNMRIYSRRYDNNIIFISNRFAEQ